MADPHDGVPQAARWRLALDGPATLRSTRSGNATRNEVFVGTAYDISGGRAFQWIRASAQPALDSVLYTPPPRADETSAAYRRRANAETHFVAFKLKPGMATAFELTTAGGN